MLSLDNLTEKGIIKQCRILQVKALVRPNIIPMQVQAGTVFTIIYIYIYFHSVSRFFESEFRLRLPMTAIRFIGESVALGFVSAATATVRADERNPVLLIL